MKPDLDAIRARNLVDWIGNGKEELSGDVAALLAYIDELERDPSLARVHLLNHQVREDAPERPTQFTVSATWKASP